MGNGAEEFKNFDLTVDDGDALVSLTPIVQFNCDDVTDAIRALYDEAGNKLKFFIYDGLTYESLASNTWDSGSGGSRHSYPALPTTAYPSDAIWWQVPVTLDYDTNYAVAAYIYDSVLAQWDYITTYEFHTIAAPGGLTKPTNPTPENESTEVDWSGLTLTWENGGGAVSYDVYFGNTVLFDEFIFLGNTEDTSIVVPYTMTGDNITVQGRAFVGEQTVFNEIDWNDVLYWRVDARDGEGNIVTGDVWSFDPRPPKTSTPSPANEYAAMTLDWSAFGWDAVAIATSYDTYISSDGSSFTNVINSGATNSITQADFLTGIKSGFNSAGLASYNSTYYWRTDSKNLFGVTEGDTWEFTTITFLPPLNLQSEYDVYWYALATKRALVVCADNKVWYEE